jgi:UDP-glucose 6-dehydrogenase
MRIAIFGLGYVVCVSAASWLDIGHHVIGVGINVEGEDDQQRGSSDH